MASGCVTRGLDEVMAQLARLEKSKTYVAAMGFAENRQSYRYKKEKRKKAPRTYRHRDMFFRQAYQGRNTVWFSHAEKEQINKVWQAGLEKWVNGDASALQRAADHVAKTLLIIIRLHMLLSKGETGIMRDNTKAVRQNKNYRADKGNVNYLHGPEMDRIRRTGLLVDTGQLYQSMTVGTTKVR